MSREISFSQAVEGFVMAVQARHLSHHTVDDYFNTFRKFDCFLDSDPTRRRRRQPDRRPG